MLDKSVGKKDLLAINFSVVGLHRMALGVRSPQVAGCNLYVKVGSKAVKAVCEKVGVTFVARFPSPRIVPMALPGIGAPFFPMTVPGAITTFSPAVGSI